MAKKKKETVNHLKKWSEPVEIEKGEFITDDVLVEFLDWSLVNNTKDWQMFKHLKETGFFEKNPIRSQDLKAAVQKLAKKA